MRNSRLMRKISKVSFSTDPDQEFPLPPVSPTRQASTSSDVSANCYLMYLTKVQRSFLAG